MKMKHFFYYLFLAVVCLMMLLILGYGHALDVKPGERLNLNMINVTNVTYPCLLVGNETYLSASIAPGNYTCNITGSGQEEVITISTGGGRSLGRYVKPSKPAINDTSFNLGSVESKKPYWASIVQDKPKEEAKPTIEPKEEVRPPEPVKNETINQESKPESFNWWPLIILVGVILITLVIVIIGYATSENR